MKLPDFSVVEAVCVQSCLTRCATINGEEFDPDYLISVLSFIKENPKYRDDWKYEPTPMPVARYYLSEACIAYLVSQNVLEETALETDIGLIAGTQYETEIGLVAGTQYSNFIQQLQTFAEQFEKLLLTNV